MVSLLFCTYLYSGLCIFVQVRWDRIGSEAKNHVIAHGIFIEFVVQPM